MRRLPLLSLILVLAACGAAPPAMQMPPPPQVGVAAAIGRELPVERDLTGRLEAVGAVAVMPQVSGLIHAVLVRDGAEVKAGDALFEIDPEPSKAEVARAEAAVAQADAQQQLATSNRARNTGLAAQGLVSPQVLDDSVAAERSAAANLASAKAALRTAQLDLGYCTVQAPIGGRLGRIQTTVGNLVQGGGPVPATLLTTLVTVDPVYAAFDLDEATYRRIAARLATSAGGGAKVPVTVGLAGEEGHPHPGFVSFVDNQIDTASGSIRLRATIPDPGHRLTPGAYARILLEIDAPRRVVLINEQAVKAQLATRFVLTVDGKGVTAFRAVQLGPAHGPLREAVSGLEAGERIVVTNLAKVFQPGMPVAPLEVDMETLVPPAAATASATAAAAGN